MAEAAHKERAIIAAYDAEGIFVYQAFKPAIVDEALRQGTFGKGFNLERMTWIKPSFGWMLYRSDYATAHRQERILKIKLPHEAFLTILRHATPTAFDRRVHAAEAEWRAALDKTEVRYQWDPDRDWRLRKLERRAIQLGMQGAVVRQYVGWVAGLEDVTALARACRVAAAADTHRHRLGIPSSGNTRSRRTSSACSGWPAEERPPGRIPRWARPRSSS
jgi:hypothetical protein